MSPVTVSMLVVLLCTCSLSVLSYTTEQTNQDIDRPGALTKLSVRDLGTGYAQHFQHV